MADKILRWYVDGNIARTKTQVGGVYKVEADYRPSEVNMNVRIAGKGTLPTEIDILADGVSIFDTRACILNEQTDKKWTTIKDGIMREGSIVRLDITQVSDLDTCHDLTVELVVDKA